MTHLQQYQVRENVWTKTEHIFERGESRALCGRAVKKSRVLSSSLPLVSLVDNHFSPGQGCRQCAGSADKLLREV